MSEPMSEERLLEIEKALDWVHRDNLLMLARELLQAVHDMRVERERGKGTIREIGRLANAYWEHMPITVERAIEAAVRALEEGGRDAND